MTEPTTKVPGKKPFLYVVVCASGIAGDVGKLIIAAQEQNWDVEVVATPQGLGFLDIEAIEAQTGFPIRSAWRTPGQSRPLPPADAIAVASATFNTVNKWAAGISDTLALGILCEAYGMGIPTAVLPYLNPAQAAHPAFRRSLQRLREMDVLIGSYEPHRPKADGGADRYRWEEALELLTPVVSVATWSALLPLGPRNGWGRGRALRGVVGVGFLGSGARWVALPEAAKPNVPWPPDGPLRHQGEARSPRPIRKKSQLRADQGQTRQYG